MNAFIVQDGVFDCVGLVLAVNFILISSFVYVTGLLP
jgi:hypothetical protein